MDDNPRILIIDDDADLCVMLTEYLEAEGFETTVLHNGDAGVLAARSGQYAALILDVMMPGMGGIEVLRRIRQESPIPVIMLTAKGDHVDRVVGLEMGADDYVPKPCYPRELVARLRAVLRRVGEAGSRLHGGVLRQGRLQLLAPQRTVCWDDAPLELTVSEFNLLEILLSAKDRVVPKDELSERGLGRKRELYDRSVDVHVSNLRQKLHAVAGDEVGIETVRGVGYRIRRN